MTESRQIILEVLAIVFFVGGAGLGIILVARDIIVSRRRGLEIDSDPNEYWEVQSTCLHVNSSGKGRCNHQAKHYGNSLDEVKQRATEWYRYHVKENHPNFVGHEKKELLHIFSTRLTRSEYVKNTQFGG